MLVTYPACFYFDKKTQGYYVYFPDLKSSGTQGSDLNEAMVMASEYLGMYVASLVEDVETVPKPSAINEIDLSIAFPFTDDAELVASYELSKSFVSMVVTNVEEYLDAQELVKKTLTIPKWANDLAVRKGYNFSKILTDAISKTIIQ